MNEEIVQVLKELSTSVQANANEMKLFRIQLKAFLKYESALQERFRQDLVKVSSVLFILVFSILFGLPEVTKLLAAMK